MPFKQKVSRRCRARARERESRVRDKDIKQRQLRRAIINTRRDINEDTYIRVRFDEINVVIEDKDDKGNKE